MLTKTHFKSICGSAILGCLTALTTPAMAANDAMMDLLRVLKDKGSITQEEYELLSGAAKADDETNSAGQGEIKAAAATLPKIETRGKLELATPDGEFSWRLGGRIHMDATFMNNDTGFDASGAKSDPTLTSGTEFRRTRLDLTMTLWRVWQAKIQYDFTGAAAAGFRDVYVRYLFKGAQPGHLTVGNFKEPFSLDELISSNDDTFNEHSIATNTFSLSRQIGVQYSTWGHDLWTGTVGVFGEDPVASANHPGAGNDAEGYSVVGRLTLSPFHTADRVAHLGLAGSWRTPDQGDSGITFGPRPEINQADILVTTGAIPGIEGYTRLGLELAGVYGPVHGQAEYYNVDVNRGDELALGAAGMFEDLNFDGYYLQGGWIITGESRPYKFESGTFENPKPRSIVGNGGWGAWEAVARYSHVDLQDDDLGICMLATAANTCGEQTNLSGGVNWYPTPNFKFTAQYVQVLDIDGGRYDGAEPGIFQLHTQANW